MTLLTFSQVAVEFGATTLLQDVSFTVRPGERWGVLGRNGAGKTTLFRLITGALAPTRGTVVSAPATRIALLDQDRTFVGADTVWEAAASEYQDLMALELELARLADRLGTLGNDVSPTDLERYGREQERFLHAGGYEFHARVDAVLQGLGFDPEEAKQRSLAGLSGGERGRLGLAAQLAAPCDLLLLDEPTNHLDLATIDWLRGFLRETAATVLMISHDRAFLDDTVDHVLHVADGTATAYRGGYSDFVLQRSERRLALERQVAKQRQAIAREEDYIRRNIAGGNSAQAKGRRSRLERLPRLSAPPGEAEAMNLRLAIAERSGDQIVVAERLTVAVADRVLLRDFSAIARRGDVIALVGPNGAGKSTLIATLLGGRPPQAGTVRLGAGAVSAAWFRQDLSQVPADRTVYDCIAHLRPAWNRGAIQNHLGAFGFSGDEVKRQTATLSGGERARVALALLALTQANLLVLDEPTNHLDVESIEALEDALEDYEGTVLLVSHDRAFLRELATRVWAFDGTHLEDFHGPFVEWEPRAAERSAARSEAAAQQARVEAAAAARQVAAARSREERSRAAERTARRAAERIEREVHDSEEHVARLEAALADPALYDGSAEGAHAAGKLGQELAEARRVHEAALARWLAAVDGG